MDGQKVNAKEKLDGFLVVLLKKEIMFLPAKFIEYPVFFMVLIKSISIHQI